MTAATPADLGNGGSLEPPVTALQRLRSRGRLRGGAALVGPAFVAAVAYIDPGNFATNFAGGAEFGYRLTWVIVMANLMAVLVQYLSAKIGIATARSLPELSAQGFSTRVNVGLWIQAEVIAISTDLAEFVGAAIGLNLLFHIALFPAGLITAVVAFAILALQERGYRKFELAIMALLGFVALGFIYDFFAVGHQSGAGIAGGLVPSFAGSDSVVLAIGIIGATVMPHVIYLHSALTRTRVPAADDAERHEILRFTKIDCGIGLGAAGLINLAMLFVAVALFHRTGRTGVDSIQAAHAGLTTMVGGAAGLAFAVALLASGLSSSSVGTYAGQVVMQGFINRSIPLFLRRAITMIPALVVLALGVSTTQVLVLSQVVLSFGIPFALVPLVVLSSRRRLMGAMVNRAGTTVVAAGIAGVIIVLNVYLIITTFTG
jgi:manganese transport protein